MQEKMVQLEIENAKMQTRQDMMVEKIDHLSTAIEDLAVAVTDLKTELERKDAVFKFIKWLAGISFFGILFKLFGIKLFM